jgi:hypothetical protein
MARTIGLALNARNSESVGRASGQLRHGDGDLAGRNASGAWAAAGCVPGATSFCRSSMLISESWPSSARNIASNLRSYSMTRLAQA